MFDNKYSDINKFKLISILIGTVVGLAVTFISLFIFSFIYAYFDIAEYYNAIFATFSLIIGSFVGAMIAVNRIKEKGFLYGICIGALLFVIVLIISLLVGNNSFSLTSLFHLVSCVLSGGISGIIRVNKEINKKYLK